MSDIKALWYQNSYVGKRIESSKQEHVWRVGIDSEELEVKLYVSKYSGKRRVLVDDVESYSCKKAPLSSFFYVFQAHGHCISLIEKDRIYDLLIGPISFNNIYTRKDRMSSGSIEELEFNDWEDFAVPYKKHISYFEFKLPSENPEIKPHPKIESTHTVLHLTSMQSHSSEKDSFTDYINLEDSGLMIND